MQKMKIYIYFYIFLTWNCEAQAISRSKDLTGGSIFKTKASSTTKVLIDGSFSYPETSFTTDSLVGGSIFDSLDTIIKHCQFNHIAVFTDSNRIPGYPDGELWLKTEHLRHRIKLVHYSDQGSQREDNLRHTLYGLYLKQGVNNFFLFTNKSWDIIYEAEIYFKVVGAGSTIFPHKSKIIVAVPSKHMDEMAHKLSKTEMDNVIILEFEEYTGQVMSIHTLRWRSGRRRELEQITEISSGSTFVCTEIFPNKKLGFNGRNLVCLTKEWTTEVMISVDPVTGNKTYTGFAVDVLQEIAKSLNFTLELLPKPEDEPIPNWGDFYSLINTGFPTLSVPFWSLNLMYGSSDAKLTAPVYIGHVTGAYIDSGLSNQKRLNLLNMMDRTVIVTLFGCLLSTIIMFMVHYCLLELNPRLHRFPHSKGQEIDVNVNVPTIKVSTTTQIDDDLKLTSNQKRFFQNSPKALGNKTYNLTFAFNSKQHMEALSRKNLHTPSQDTISKDNIRNEHDTKGRCRLRKKDVLVCLKQEPSYLHLATSVIFDFVGSVLNQSTLPNPTSCSARILLWAWCLTILMLSAIFSGTLTADLIDNTYDPPFTSYEEVVESKDWKWTMDPTTGIFRIFNDSNEGSLAKRLFTGVERTWAENPSLIGNLEYLLNITHQLEDKNIIFIASNHYLARYKMKNGLRNMTIIKTPLMLFFHGFLLPRHSEFEPILSDQIGLLTQAGIIDYLLKSWQMADAEEAQPAQKRKVVNLGYMTFSLWVLAVGAGISGIVLVGEIVFKKMQACYYKTKEQS